MVLGTALHSKQIASTRLDLVSNTWDLRPQGLETLLIPTHVSIIISDILTKSSLLSRWSTEGSATLLSPKVVVSV